MKLCPHYTKYQSRDKIGNLLKKKKSLNQCDFQQFHKEEQSKDLYFCLDCGKIACTENSENACISNHFQQTQKKHKISIHLSKFYIFCFDCQEDLENQLLEFDDEEDKKYKKLEEFCEDLKKYFFNFFKQNNYQINLSGNPINNSDKNQKSNSTNNSTPSSIFGLDNIGNTCFFNSVLQCLNGTNQLRQFYLDLEQNDFQDENKIQQIHQDQENSQDHLIQGFQDSYPDQYDTQQYSKKSKKDKKKQKKQQNFDQNNNNNQSQNQNSQGQSIARINQQFQKLLLDGFSKKKHSLNPSALFKNISILFTRFITFQEEDAQELLRCLLDSLSLGEEAWHSIQRNSEKINKTKSKLTFIENLFGGYLVNYLKCLECKQISRTFDFFMDLSVQIPGTRVMYHEEQPTSKHQRKQKNKKQQRKNKKQQKKKSNADQIDQQQQEEKDNDNEENLKEELKKQQDDNCENEKDDIYQLVDKEQLKKTKIPDFDKDSDLLYEPSVYFQLEDQKNHQITIEECLNEFASFELLNKSENYFQCEKCSDSNKALRKFYLYDLPPVLNIALKRFMVTNDGLKKNNAKVIFKEKLNLDSYTMIKTKNDEFLDDEILKGEKKMFNYELYGIVEHSGTLNSGHYIAYVKHNQDGQQKWFQFNDSIVKEVSFGKIQQTVDAYLLFYRKI